MPKLLLIDGNNLAHRVFWTHKELSYSNTPIGLIYGFFKSIIGMKKTYPDHFFIVVWDSTGSKRRKEEAGNGVAQGIIPSGYKENRKELNEARAEELETMRSQMDELEFGLRLCKVKQVSVDGVEGDDIIYTYAMQNLAAGGETVVVSSDKDFYQLLEDRVTVYDAMKNETWDKQRFLVEFGFEPKLWVDVGALQGDDGDNIFGCPDWGPVTAVKYVRECGDVESVIAKVGQKEKKNKREEKLMANIPRVRLAKSLKQMDMVPMLPKTRFTEEFSEEALKAYFLKWGFASLLQEAKHLI